MPIFILAMSVIVGLAAAALTNAMVMRSPEGLALTARRKCSVCAHPVAVADMMPVIGYLRLKGQCRRCREVIPWHYIASEIAVGLLFGLFAARVLFHVWLPSFVTPDEYMLLFVRDALIAIALVFVFVFDAKASVIPDSFTVPAILVALAFNVMLGADILTMLFGMLLIGSFFAFQTIASGGKWVGGGDVRVGLLMGALLGPTVGIFALLLSYILGAAVGLQLLLFRRAKMTDHVPFGTFMVVSIVIAMFFGETLVNWYLGWFA